MPIVEPTDASGTNYRPNAWPTRVPASVAMDGPRPGSSAPGAWSAPGVVGAGGGCRPRAGRVWVGQEERSPVYTDAERRAAETQAMED